MSGPEENVRVLGMALTTMAAPATQYVLHALQAAGVSNCYYT